MTPEELSTVKKALVGLIEQAEAAESLAAEVLRLRDYLREKNEIIRAYAGPTGMTPEDVAYIVGAWKADGLGEKKP